MGLFWTDQNAAKTRRNCPATEPWVSNFYRNLVYYVTSIYVISFTLIFVYSWLRYNFMHDWGTTSCMTEVQLHFISWNQVDSNGFFRPCLLWKSSVHCEYHACHRELARKVWDYKIWAQRIRLYICRILWPRDRQWGVHRLAIPLHPHMTCCMMTKINTHLL